MKLTSMGYFDLEYKSNNFWILVTSLWPKPPHMLITYWVLGLVLCFMRISLDGEFYGLLVIWFSRCYFRVFDLFACRNYSSSIDRVQLWRSKGSYFALKRLGEREYFLIALPHILDKFKATSPKFFISFNAFMNLEVSSFPNSKKHMLKIINRQRSIGTRWVSCSLAHTFCTIFLSFSGSLLKLKPLTIKCSNSPKSSRNVSFLISLRACKIYRLVSYDLMVRVYSGYPFNTSFIFLGSFSSWFFWNLATSLVLIYSLKSSSILENAS